MSVGRPMKPVTRFGGGGGGGELCESYCHLSMQQYHERLIVHMIIGFTS